MPTPLLITRLTKSSFPLPFFSYQSKLSQCEMHCSIKKRMKANKSLKSYALIDVLELPYLLKGLEEGRKEGKTSANR